MPKVKSVPKSQLVSKEGLMPIWVSPDGTKVACTEKIKVMQQNIEELQQMAQDAFEDGVLMGIDPMQLKSYLLNLIKKLHNPY
jgi:predicted peroxiredoxin